MQVTFTSGDTLTPCPRLLRNHNLPSNPSGSVQQPGFGSSSSTSAAAPTAPMSPAAPAPLHSCTPNRTLNIPSQGLAQKESSLFHILRPVERHQPGLFHFPAYSKSIPSGTGLVVSAHHESESLLYFVCPRWFCWIKLGLCWPHLLGKAIP